MRFCSVSSSVTSTAAARSRAPAREPGAGADVQDPERGSRADAAGSGSRPAARSMAGMRGIMTWRVSTSSTVAAPVGHVLVPLEQREGERADPLQLRLGEVRREERVRVHDDAGGGGRGEGGGATAKRAARAGAGNRATAAMTAAAARPRDGRARGENAGTDERERAHHERPRARGSDPASVARRAKAHADGRRARERPRPSVPWRGRANLQELVASTGGSIL